MCLCDVWSFCDWYCDDVFVWRVKAFAIDIVTMFLCDVWRFCDVLILWQCFWVCDVWSFVKWWYCDDVSVWRVKVLWCGDIVTMFLSVTCEGFVKWWYCDDVSGWSAKILCLILCRCFCVWRMKDLCLIPVLWRCFCVRVKVLCNTWSSVTIFFFWINFDFWLQRSRLRSNR